MKKFGIIFLTLFYLAFNLGFGVNINYCDGEVSSIELTILDGECCCGPKQMAPACCSTETLILQSTEEQQLGAGWTFSSPVDLFVGYAPLTEEFVQEEANPLANVKDPPDREGPPIYLEFRRLLYYG